MTGDFEIDDFLHRHVDDMCTERMLDTLTGMDRAGFTLLGASITKLNQPLQDYLSPIPREPIQMTTEVDIRGLKRRFMNSIQGFEIRYQHR